MPKQDFFSKQQTKGTFSGGTIRQQPKKDSSGHFIFWLIVLILILGISVCVFRNKLFNPKINPTLIDNEYTIGSEIQEEGVLVATGDLLNYTHTLTNDKGNVFLLKSKSISLNNISNLSGRFMVEGMIESIYNGYPLVEVIKISSLSNTDYNNDNSITENGTTGIYLSEAGIGFPINFYDKYSFLGNAGENGTISIKNLDTEKVININYFKCTDAGDTNCKQLTKTFDTNAIKKITTSNGDSYYKLPDVKSRYFQNKDWWGYFINDADDDEIENLIDYIIIPNDEIIKDIVTRYGVKVCLGTDQGLNKIVSYDVNKTNSNILVSMKGEGEKSFTCQAMIDLNHPSRLKFVDIQLTESAMEQSGENIQSEEIKMGQETTQKEIATTSGNPVVTPSVTQFPISTEKTMVYSSTRGGYSMTFPSSNISYTSNSTSESFGQNGVNCTNAVKVIQYKNKDYLQTNPAVIIYECNLKNEFNLLGTNYMLKKLGNKSFIIEVKDPSWFDFAKNIVIASL